MGQKPLSHPLRKPSPKTSSLSHPLSSRTRQKRARKPPHRDTCRNENRKSMHAKDYHSRARRLLQKNLCAELSGGELFLPLFLISLPHLLLFLRSPKLLPRHPMPVRFLSPLSHAAHPRAVNLFYLSPE